jgi:hypothetical protein
MKKYLITFAGNFQQVFEIESGQIERGKLQFFKGYLKGEECFINRDQILYFMKTDESKHQVLSKQF